jgi:hypothetical protein
MAGLVSEVERRSLGERVDGHRSTVAFLRLGRHDPPPRHGIIS